MDALSQMYVGTRKPSFPGSCLGTHCFEGSASRVALDGATGRPAVPARHFVPRLVPRNQMIYSVAIYLTVVAAVAIYDMILTIQYWRSLKQMEANPVGRWLMNLDHIADGTMPNLTLFITIKSIGTLFVLATILTLILRRSRIGHPVAVGVSSFQVGLAAYLTFSDH